MSNDKHKEKFDGLKTAVDVVDAAIKNAVYDRGMTSLQIDQLNSKMMEANSIQTHQAVGTVMAKYLEALQRSNDQLIKCSELKRRIEEKEIEDKDLKTEEVEDMFKKIKEK